ncbi:MAG TPA: RidA family protein [Woeseiaceae bacterium]|nr:RidA family protein [Woeseiaceae bacterium]
MKMTLVIVLALIVGAFAMNYWQTHYADDNKLQVFKSAQNADLGLPFSEATRIGNTMYVSGQIGVKPGSLALVPGGIKAETRQTLMNIRDTLERYGSSMDQVARCTVFIRDMDEWPLMNEAYVEVFGTHKPARAAVGASGLALGGSVEIECIAYVE